MTHHIKILLALAGLVIAVGIFSAYVYKYMYKTGVKENPSEYGTDNDGHDLPVGKSSMVPYINRNYGLQFEYPSNLYFKEKTKAESVADLSIVLVENTKESAGYIEGNPTTSEAPISIMIDVHSNPSQIGPRSWAEKNANWNIANKSSIIPIEIGGQTGISYTSTGLYESKTYVVSLGSNIYTFSVSWMTQNDQLLRDFDMIINSVVFN
jgi:hypothetical protein